MSDAFHKSDKDDPFKTKEWDEYSEQVIRDMLPKMKSSEVVVSIATGKDKADVKLAVEIGFCLLLGKPLVLMVDQAEKLPPGLLRAADEVVYGEIQHPKTRQAMVEAMERLVPGISKEES